MLILKNTVHRYYKINKNIVDFLNISNLRSHYKNLTKLYYNNFLI